MMKCVLYVVCTLLAVVISGIIFEVVADDTASSPTDDKYTSVISGSTETTRRDTDDSIKLCNPGEFADELGDDEIDLFTPSEDEEDCSPCDKVLDDLIAPKLLIGQDGAVRLIGLNSTLPERTVANKTDMKAYSVDYHYKRKLVFFATQNKIIRAKLVSDGLVSSCRVLPVHLTGPTSLAVDWVHDKLYWMTDNRRWIEVSNLDGSNRTAFLIDQLDTHFPKNIVVDPYAGFVFLVNKNSIFRAGLDGSNFEKLPLPSSTVGNISRIAIDRHNRKLYFFGWSAVKESYLAVTDYHGNNGRMFLKPNQYDWDDVISIDVFRERLILATFYTDYWNRIEVLGSTMHVNGYATDSDKVLWSVKVFHPSVQQRHDRKKCMRNAEKVDIAYILKKLFFC